VQSARGVALGPTWAPVRSRSLMSVSTDANEAAAADVKLDVSDAAGDAAEAAADVKFDMSDAAGDAAEAALEASGDVGNYKRDEVGDADMAQITPKRIMLDEQAVEAAQAAAGAERAAQGAATRGASVFDTEVQAAGDLARASLATSGLTRALAAVRQQRLSRAAREALLGAGSVGGAGRGKDLKPRPGRESADFLGDDAGVAANMHGRDGSAGCNYDDQANVSEK
jgi:hypothetical protein